MKKIFIILLLIFLAGCGSPITKTEEENNKKQACFGDRCFGVEIADTNDKRVQGLMYRENLAPDSGMLFIFPEIGEHKFWMKNMLIPLDMIWLDENQKIIFISKNFQPCDNKQKCPAIKPDKKAKYVLEINAGMADEINLQTGGYIDLITKKQ
ncbi:MAG: DUF192 domain-containing protein [Patescibacteria group bacterium]|jgi:hypothetical protein